MAAKKKIQTNHLIRRKLENDLPKKSTTNVVGIGASAGGLDAFEHFFTRLPTNTGLAFVVVSHLDKSHHSILPELIGNYTDMKVQTIKSGLRTKPNTIYVLPPNYSVIIKHNLLKLIEPASSSSGNQAIDVFFQSLAEDQGENAIAIVLSGTGRDGTEGIKAIKKEGGTVFVQDPAFAKYSAMPQNAIETGLVDHILPVEKIPAQLIKWLHFGFVKDGKISTGLQEIFKMLRAQTGHDFSCYKLNTICRRIERQMNSRRIDSLTDYVRFLRLHPHEVGNLVKDLLIGVTSFFRDHDAFEALKKEILPKLLKTKSADYTFRVWVPGCSTGEEVYSIAIIIREVMAELRHYCNVQIFGTDIDLVALEAARGGVYSENKVLDISPERLKHFFIKERNKYKVHKEIRKMVVFGAQNIIKDPPFTKLDMICCRNLLIYLNSQQQKKLFPIFHYSLKPKGILFLGTSESISEAVDLFRLVIKKWKIFERKDVVSLSQAILEFPTSANLPTFVSNQHPPIYDSTLMHEDRLNQTQLIRKYLLDHYVSPCFVIDKKGSILYVHGNFSLEWELEMHDFKANINDFLPRNLKLKFKEALKQIAIKQKEITFKNVNIRKNEKSYKYDLKITPVSESGLQGIFLVILDEVFTSRQKQLTQKKYSSAIKMSKRILELERELQYTRENLQTMIEELQSNNEELQSTNEELQSTNEEIETSKEELQSLNEELVISNTELQNQIDQLASVNDDINNLFNSTEVAAIFLDTEMNIKRFTPKAQNIVHLIYADIGRSINHFATNIIYDDLIKDALEVIKTLHHKSFEVLSKDNKWYNVKILPYKTVTNVIDGVIITFSDITEHKGSQEKLKGLNHELKDMQSLTDCLVNLYGDSLLVLNSQLSVMLANPEFYKLLECTPENILNLKFFEMLNHQFDKPEIKKFIEMALKHNEVPSKVFKLDLEDNMTIEMDAYRIKTTGGYNLILIIRRK